MRSKCTVSHFVPDRDKLTLQLVAGCAMMLLRRTHKRNVHEAAAAVPLRSLDLRTDFRDVADRKLLENAHTLATQITSS